MKDEGQVQVHQVGLPTNNRSEYMRDGNLWGAYKLSRGIIIRYTISSTESRDWKRRLHFSTEKKQPTAAEPTPAAEHDPDVEMPDEPAEPTPEESESTTKPALAPTEPTPEESSKPASNPAPTPVDIDIELTDDDESPDDDEIPEGQFLTPPAIVLPSGLGTTNTIDAKA
ncbi:hypothetical protein FPRO05_05199 [Fusarium proliferatum]|uniref:Uncharacterized protein n=1 Tax=Gibberella intermedia TaxID=948311 RepID=A0A365MPX4_GIBIN|nr:hypothetical protein FPRO05_05199 [Fusarium proliferatum]